MKLNIGFSLGGGNIKQNLLDKSFKKFAKMFYECEKGDKKGSYFIIGPIIDPPNKRCDDNIPSASVLVIDGDSKLNSKGKVVNGAPTLSSAHEAAKRLNLNHFIYTSHSHTRKVNKWRLVIEIKGKFEKKYHAATARHVVQKLNAKSCSVALSRESYVWSQAWYMPRRDDPEDGLYEFKEFHDGKGLKPIKEESENDSTVSSATVEKESYSDLKKQIKSGKHFRTPLRKLIWMEANHKFPRQTIIEKADDWADDSPRKDKSHKEHESWEVVVKQIPDLVDSAIEKCKSSGGVSEKEIEEVESSSETYNIRDFIRFEECGKTFSTLFKMFERLAVNPQKEILTVSLLYFLGIFTQKGFRDRSGNIVHRGAVIIAGTAIGKNRNTRDIFQKLIPVTHASAEKSESPLKKYLDYHVITYQDGHTGTKALANSFNSEIAKSKGVHTVCPEAREIYERSSQNRKKNTDMSTETMKISLLNGDGYCKEYSDEKNSIRITGDYYYSFLDAIQKDVLDSLNKESIESGFIGRLDLLYVSDEKRFSGLVSQEVIDAAEQKFKKEEKRILKKIAKYYSPKNLKTKKLIISEEDLARINEELAKIMKNKEGMLLESLSRLNHNFEKFLTVVWGIEYIINGVKEFKLKEWHLGWLRYQAKVREQIIRDNLNADYYEMVRNNIIQRIRRAIKNAEEKRKRGKEIELGKEVTKGDLVRDTKKNSKIVSTIEKSSYVPVSDAIYQIIEKMEKRKDLIIEGSYVSLNTDKRG